MSFRPLVLSVALVAVLPACDQTGNSSADMSAAGDMAVVVPHNFTQIDNVIIKQSCSAFSVCHSTEGASTAAGLNLAIDAYAELINKPAVNDMAKNEGRVLVKPCDPDNSFLWIKLNLPETQLDPKVGYGGSMPQSSPHLPDAQLKAIKDWISRGAKRSEPDDVTGTTCSPDTDAGL